MEQELGHDEAMALCEALATEPTTSVRLNPLKMTTSKWESRKVEWSRWGYLLDARPSFTLDADFHAGAYYVQEASSQFAGYIMSQALGGEQECEGKYILDMCAAPGGKSTHYATLVGERGLVVANEINRSRAAVLADNARKWGLGNMVVSCNDSSRFRQVEEWFDAVAVDAPCSGEGMFRKDASARDEWSTQAVKHCAERQRSILADVWDALKPGGVLLYSTCTFNREENEDNVQWICEALGAEVLPIAYESTWGITEGSVGYHFYPHRAKGEGFYLCALRKNDDEEVRTVKIKTPKNSPACPHPEFLGAMRSWLQHPEEWAIRYVDRFATAYPIKYKELIDWLSTQLTCISTGFGLGEERGRGIAPQHSLSMAKDLNKEAFPTVALSREQALSYLRTEALSLVDVPLGLLLLTYEGVPLGFAKNVGNRQNNLYPNEWRIRHL